MLSKNDDFSGNSSRMRNRDQIKASASGSFRAQPLLNPKKFYQNNKFGFADGSNVVVSPLSSQDKYK